jgi:hypothetical protein
MREREGIEVFGQPLAVFRRIHRFEAGRKGASRCWLCAVGFLGACPQPRVFRHCGLGVAQSSTPEPALFA